eukprot:UN11831
MLGSFYVIKQIVFCAPYTFGRGMIAGTTGNPCSNGVTLVSDKTMCSFTCDVGYEFSGESVVECPQGATIHQEATEWGACTICVNWFGNNLNWNNIPFERFQDNWGYTPNGCTPEAVEPYGAYR